jgi:hypothetical protein
MFAHISSEREVDIFQIMALLCRRLYLECLISLILYYGKEEREREKSTSNELSSVFTNNGDLKIDLGEFLSLLYAVNHLSYNCGARNH